VSEWLAGLSDLEAMTAGAIYAVVFTLVFVESGLLVGFFLPGDSVLFTAGLLTADGGHGLSLPLLVAGVVGCAVAGDAVGYWSGRRFGRLLRGSVQFKTKSSWLAFSLRARLCLRSPLPCCPRSAWACRRSCRSG